MAQELGDLEQRTRVKIGQSDANYIRRVRAFVWATEAAGRLMLLAAWFPPAWIVGALLLGVSKIVDNMELGHNVMHGQFNFMNDPDFNGERFEWDNTCPASEWRHAHNYVHHTYTNVIGMDRDFGYGLLRLSNDLRWSWLHPFQLLWTALLALLFEWFVAVHDMQLDKLITGRRRWEDLRPQWLHVRSKFLHQLTKDYVLWPALAACFGTLWGHGGEAACGVLIGNATANMTRNVWAWAIIFCGHFTAEVVTFSKDSIQGETRGHWYLRQILGSSNIQGGKLFHLLSGNLSHQIEHHLFPDLPANRYAELAPEVQAICRRYGVPYHTGSFSRQLFTVIGRIARYSLPGGPHKATSLQEASRMVGSP